MKLAKLKIESRILQWRIDWFVFKTCFDMRRKGKSITVDDIRAIGEMILAASSEITDHVKIEVSGDEEVGFVIQLLPRTELGEEILADRNTQ